MPFVLTHEPRPVIGRLEPIAGVGLRERRGRWLERHLSPIFGRLPGACSFILGEDNLRRRIIVLGDLPVSYASDVNCQDRFHDEPEPRKTVSAAMTAQPSFGIR